MQLPKLIRRLCGVFLLVMTLFVPSSSAWAQVIDRIEINRAGKDAEITVRFSTRVQYTRHGPLKPGKLLRVFIQLVNPDVPESDLMQQTITAPRTDLVPPFTVTYPELSNGILFTFTHETSWEVRQGTDGRSVVIKVPALPGAKDVLAETSALAQVQQESLEAPAESSKLPVAASSPTTAALPAPVDMTPPLPDAPRAPAPVQLPPAAVATTVPVAPTPRVAAVAVPPPAAVPASTQPSPTVATASPPAAPSASDVPGTAPSGVAATTSPPEAAPILTSDQVETMAATFLGEARKAIADGDLPRAVSRLNRTLGLPTNSQTEPAQALIGEVREMAGETAKARAEYELYLKAYPGGPSAPRVKERLAQLPVTAPRVSARKALPAEAGPAEWTFYGSLSQYLYKGNSHTETETRTAPAPGQLTFTTDVLDATDQNSLISSVDLNARRRDGLNDTRIVVRDTYSQNYLGRKNTNRLYSAYIEQSNRREGYLVRAGRQNPTGGGVLERFDGLTAGYNIDGRWRVNGVMGIPVEFSTDYKKSFYGVSVDMQAQPEHVGLSTYFLQQRMLGVVNRQAVGLEARYFDMNSTVFGLLDYDLAFKDLNILMAQGNYRTEAGTNYFTYLDHRKSPSLGLNNVVQGLSGVSIKQALDTMGVAQLRADAKALTATSDMVAVGVTHPYSPRWLFGTDYRAAKVSGTGAVNSSLVSAQAQASTGLNHVFSVQAIGNGLWTENDVGVVNASYIVGQTYDGQALGFNYVFLNGDSWRFDGNLRYYAQKDNLGERQQRWTPSLKVGYRWKQVTLEAEIGAEEVAIEGPARVERSNRQYFFVGYRWDFR